MLPARNPKEPGDKPIFHKKISGSGENTVRARTLIGVSTTATKSGKRKSILFKKALKKL